MGWSFTITLSARYTFVRRPVLPLLTTDTRAEIAVELHLRQNRSSFSLEKDCSVNVIHTPGGLATALSSIFVESRNGEVALRIALGTLEAPRVTSPLACMYMWAFELDMGFLLPFYKNARVTGMMFWPEYPGHAVGEGGGVPEQEPWPVGSPMYAVNTLCGDVMFEKMSKSFYCKGESWEGKKFWRLVAVGSM